LRQATTQTRPSHLLLRFGLSVFVLLPHWNADCWDGDKLEVSEGRMH